jgi:DNA repair exonuclease SbcCD ATPase subunit
MSGLKKIKSLFWQEPETPSAAPLSPEPLAPIPPPPVYTAPEPVLSAPAAPVAVDQEFYSGIEKEIGKAMTGEFVEFYNQMSVINEKFGNLDEPTRYQLAFHAAQTALKARNINLTFMNLLKAMDQLNEVLDVEKREFQMQNNQGYQANLNSVKSKSEEIGQGIKARENRLQAIQQELEAFLAAKNAEKKKLEEERNSLVSQRVVVESELNQLEMKKEERAKRFEAALQAHAQRLAQLKDKLQSNLRSIK